MPDSPSGNLWIFFALMTVASWGLYGVFLHMGQVGMGDPVNGRYKAFLFVGIAYVLIAVLAPAALMIANGSDWTFPTAGWTKSLVAGAVGAVGAFCVLLAFGKGGQPAVVMSIIFAGILLAAAGGTLVTLYKPAPGAAPPAQPPVEAESAQ